MSGVTIVGELLTAPAPVALLKEAGQVKEGRLPDGVRLPAILLRSISLVERLTLKRGSIVRVTERVSVTVRAGSYREQKTLIKLIRNSCAGRTGTIAGFDRVAVLSAGTGPDLIGPGNSFEQTQDFSVSYDQAA